MYKIFEFEILCLMCNRNLLIKLAILDKYESLLRNILNGSG
jgi:hypothetical protein